MKILIYGKTSSGKSTFSKALSNKINFKVHSMGELFRNSNKGDLTKTSETMLKEDLNCNMKYISEKFNSDFDNIIFEGFRNPIEFSKLLDNNCIVLKLNHTGLEYKDDFEKDGIELIDKIIEFISDRSSFVFKEFSYNKYEDLETCLDIMINILKDKNN